MTNRIDSPYPDEYPGYIVLPDDLTWMQLVAVDAMLTNSRAAPTLLGAMASMDTINTIVEWHIDTLPEKPTAENIFTLRGKTGKRKSMKSAMFFYRWVQVAVAKLFNTVDEIPNALPSRPTDTQPTPTAEIMTEDQTQNQSS